MRQQTVPQPQIMAPLSRSPRHLPQQLQQLHSLAKVFDVSPLSEAEGT